MKNVFVINKKEGETPLEALEVFRKRNKNLKNKKMTYAGRLDPMAIGVLVLLAGEETKNKEKYLALNKEYEFEVLFGFATDTYDILGKVISSGEYLGDGKKLKINIEKNLKYFVGKFTQKYPMYSSKTVKGKQLFEYARDGVYVEVPEREVFVKKLQFLKLRKIDNRKLLANIEKRVRKVKGDFRQKEILKIWRKKLSVKKLQYFFVGKFEISCSSGTYVRGIANSLGNKLSLPALAFSIKRTKVGKWGLGR